MRLHVVFAVAPDSASMKHIYLKISREHKLDIFVLRIFTGKGHKDKKTLLFSNILLNSYLIHHKSI